LSAVTLETRRLVLRQFRNSDLDAWAPICADEEVMRYLGTGVTLSRADAWRSMAGILGHWELLGYGMFALESKATGELIGRVGFLEPEGWPGFELGWVLARPFWGQGYAYEAAVAARDHAFGPLGRDRLISLIRSGNKPSIRLAERLGEKLAGEVDLLGSKALLYELRR
jgi:RimJ/RimL family protein N-acetyltransferase